MQNLENYNESDYFVGADKIVKTGDLIRNIADYNYHAKKEEKYECHSKL